MKTIFLFVVVWLSIGVAGLHLFTTVPWPEPMYPALSLHLMGFLTWLVFIVGFLPLVMFGILLKRKRLSQSQSEGRLWDA